MPNGEEATVEALVPIRLGVSWDVVLLNFQATTFLWYLL